MSKMTDNHIADDGKKVFTDKEIIKALKHCYEHKSCNDCVGCLGAEECILNVDPAGYIYPIINRQQAEIERLKAENEKAKTYLANCFDKYEKTKIAKDSLENTLYTARAEAIKEFAKKVKAKCDYMNDYYGSDYGWAIDRIYEEVDDIAKEMVGEGK